MACTGSGAGIHFTSFRREVGRLLENLDPFHSTRRPHRFPPLNLYDAGDKYLLSVQLPGMLASDIDLSITGAQGLPARPGMGALLPRRFSPP